MATPPAGPDPRLLAAADIVIRHGWASVDLLGRTRLKLTPTAAKAYLAELERRGIVGPEKLNGSARSVNYHPMGIDRTLALAHQRSQEGPPP